LNKIAQADPQTAHYYIGPCDRNHDLLLYGDYRGQAWFAQHVVSSLDDVFSAGLRLRALRVASGTALLQIWKGQRIDLGIDETFLEGLVDRLRENVHVYEVEAVTLGEVPSPMLGWWIPLAFTGRYESESAQASLSGNVDEDDDGGTA
jgi:hypothetical protein